MSFEGRSWFTRSLLACTLVACSGTRESPYAGAAGTGAVAAPQAGSSGGGAGALASGAGSVAAGTGDVVARDAAVAVDVAVDAAVDAAVADASSRDTDAAVMAPKPRCLTKGSQVVLLGDSYINWVSHTFPSDLNTQAGQTFRLYAIGAYSMGSGGIGFIPPQLDKAISDDPDIIAAVVDGGGNDILVPDTMQFPQGGDCKMSATSPMIPDCQKIVAKAITAADGMLNDAVAHGIGHVVYFFYPNVPEGTLIGGTHPNAILDYAEPLVKDFCDGAVTRTGGKLSCHFIDLRPVFKDHPEYFAPTDIHPNSMGSGAMAKIVWQTMKDNCVAQPESSGCCEP